MKQLFLIALFFLCTQVVSAQVWTTQEFETANTAMDIEILTSEEKEVIRYINLARLYPKKFAAIEITNCLADGSYSENGYVNSLLNTLKHMKPVGALYFNDNMYQLAKCFAEESGASGYTGHNRKTCKKGYDAECCSYGYENGRQITIQLLIDEGVPSLGHRIICLDKSMEKVGVNIQPHAKYNNCCVLDFKRNEINYAENNKKGSSAFFNKLTNVFK